MIGGIHRRRRGRNELGLRGLPCFGFDGDMLYCILMHDGSLYIWIDGCMDA